MNKIIFAFITTVYIFFAYKMLFVLIKEEKEIKKNLMRLILEIVSSFYGVYLGVILITKLTKII